MYSKLVTVNLFVLLGLGLLTSCGGGGSSSDSAEEKEKTLEEIYSEFKQSEEFKKCISFDEALSQKLDVLVKTSSLPVKPELLSAVKLDFQKNTLAGVYYSPFFLGEKKDLNWAMQDTYNLFFTALKDGIEEYKVKGVTNLKSSWEYTQMDMVQQITNSEYYLVLVVNSFKMPDAIDDRNYASGIFAGKVIVLDTKTMEKVGSFDVVAQNSESLMFPEGGIVKAIREDFEKNINTNLMEGLKTNCAEVKHGTRNKEPKLEIVL